MLTDDELVQGFEAGSLTAFPHAQHVRLTIIYLARHGRDEALRKMCDGLLRFATAKGDPEKFLEAVHIDPEVSRVPVHYYLEASVAKGPAI